MLRALFIFSLYNIIDIDCLNAAYDVPYSYLCTCGKKGLFRVTLCTLTCSEFACALLA
jgi:hypothetical protein